MNTIDNSPTPLHDRALLSLADLMELHSKVFGYKLPDLDTSALYKRYAPGAFEKKTASGYRRLPSCKALARGLRHLLKRTGEAMSIEDIISYETKRLWLCQPGGRRNYFTFHYAWAIPSDEAIQAIVAFAEGRRILEVCAGNGLWAALIRQAGGDIVPTDNKAWKNNRKELAFLPIRKMRAETAVKKIPAGVLMLCWPCYNDEFSYHALKAFKGDRLVYVGEEEGCTATDKFRRELAKNWEWEDEFEIPQFDGINDMVYLYHRKPSK